MGRRKSAISRRGLWWTAGALVLLGVVIWSGVFGMRLVYRHWGYFFLKPAHSQWPEGAAQRIRDLVGDRRGRIVWSSSRTRTHQIFLMTLPDLRLYQLTDHPHVSYHPRFSPEGQRIVFARSQRPWVSERDQVPWDVYLLELSGGKEKLAARDGNFPLWLPDGERILFLRKSQVVVKDLQSGRERVVFDGRKPPFDGEPSNPELSPWDPRLLSVTLRGRTHGIFIINLETGGHTLLSGPGCEATWRPDRREIVWVQNGGRGETQIMLSPLERIRPSVFMDLPFSFSHEYFPRFSADGKWFIWGASEGDHEHDIADYEIFLWKVGTPWDQAVRLTYNSANDRFPDLFWE